MTFQNELLECRVSENEYAFVKRCGKTMRYILPLLSGYILLLALPLCDAVTMPAIFSDNMFCNKGVAAPIWGKGGGGRKNHCADAPANTSYYCRR